MRAVAVLISSLILAACNMAADAQDGEPRGSGRTAQRSFDVPVFDSVSLGGHYNAVITVGSAPSVRAEGDAEEIERMEVKVVNGDLRVGRRKDNKWSIDWNRNSRPVTVYVTAPSLKAASIGGAGDMRIDRVEGPAFAASIGGAGDMRIGALKVNAATFSIGGAGGITAAGTAADTDISIAGSGDIDLSALESRTASVSVVGSGNVRARAMDTASVSIIGSGDVTMDGTARCSVTKLGSGDVRCTRT